ncbi:MMPL family transporter [Pyrobaculum calidifontis]|uniref:MMPL family transporter n=1 Tax=Pyrobaculum calidifontis TaxID=181486 RepID=UPI00032305A3|nr:MMPL family transporter [Pyrobaculum calidifontis]
MKRTVAAAVALLILYVYLALHSPNVFSVLVYDESKLTPPDVEPKLVDSIVKQKNGSGVNTVPVVIFGPFLEDKARNLTKLFPNSTTPWTILDKALDIYWRRIKATVENATVAFRDVAVAVANATGETCSELKKLVQGYTEARERARELLLATYGVAALGKAVDNKTEEFLKKYREYVAVYDVDVAVRLAAEEVYGVNASRLLANVTWRTWASEGAVENVTEAILSTALNKTLIQLAREVATVGVEKYVYVSTVNKAPPVLRPYLSYLVCNGDVDRAVELFRADLLRNITAQYPPPTLDTQKLASQLVYRGKYALAFVKATEDKPVIPLALGVPVSMAYIMDSFREIVTQDVSSIDKTTATSLLVVLLAVMGTLAAPLVIVSTVGLTYLAVLGFLEQISSFQGIYYLVVYMAAPVVFAIGVDYMLLMTSRYGEERATGKSKREAIDVVVKYARRAIAASAAVVATSLGSFALSTLPFMQSIGIGYIITTAFVVASVFVVFPAILYVLGDKIFWPRKKVVGHTGRSRLMAKAVDLALRRPLAVAAVALAATLVSFIFLTTTLKITTDPVVAMPETQHKKALEIATKYFSNITAISTTYVVMREPPPPQVLATVEGLPHYVNHTVEKIGDWYVINVRLSVEDTSDELLKVYQLLKPLKDQYGALIGGAASWKNVVFNEIYVRFWNFQVYVVIVAVFVILAVLLKSFLIPLRLIATVLMSIAWSLALEVLLFQELAGQPTYWLVPIILFAFLMAVGTDYDIFIIARIREELEKGLGEREAIKRAIVTTGPVITGAALILATAFSTLLLSQLTLLRQVGFTIAFAALVDAFVIRPLVVPALIVLAGKYNWLWVTGYSVKVINPELGGGRGPSPLD